MAWIKFEIHTDINTEDFIVAELYELGYSQIEVNDNQYYDTDIQGVYEELQPDLSDSDEAVVSFYVDDTEDLEEVRRIVSEALAEYDVTVSESLCEQEDWANNWKEFFKAFTVEDCYIKPSWEDTPADLGGKTLVEIDPGMSFGTGKHESTQLVIKDMVRYMKNTDKVLDVGCGSGILSAIAAKKGVGSIEGIDIDPDCIASTYDNLSLNKIAFEKSDFVVGDITTDAALQKRFCQGQYDVVLANLLADIIMGMAKQLYECTKPGGYLITSGIIDFKAKDVADKLSSVGFKVLGINEQGEWRGITCSRSL